MKRLLTIKSGPIPLWAFLLTSMGYWTAGHLATAWWPILAIPGAIIIGVAWNIRP